MAASLLKDNLHYRYARCMTAYETWEHLNINDADGRDRIIAELELGTVRITAVACVKGLDNFTCFDIYVKDRADVAEYVFHGSIYEWIDYVAADLEELLNQKLKTYLKKHNLSYAECHFPIKPGYRAKKMMKGGDCRNLGNVSQGGQENPCHAPWR